MVTSVPEVRTTSPTANAMAFHPFTSESSATRPSRIFWRCALNVAPAVTQVVFVSVITTVFPPATISGAVPPLPPKVPDTAADSTVPVMVVVGVAINAAPPMAVAGTVVVMTSLVTIR